MRNTTNPLAPAAPCVSFSGFLFVLLVLLLLFSLGLRASAIEGQEAPASPGPKDYFAIQVVDDATGRGVPLVELRTTSEVSLYTDSAGLVAFLEPGLMGRKVFFTVKSHGYEYPQDGFGLRGVALVTTPGTTAVLKIRRLNVAERLYRVTGQGIYRDSVLLGRPVPIREPLLAGEVAGQDSVMATVYRGKIYYFWGDTARMAYGLGHFGTAGAVSELPGSGGLDPARGVDLEYFLGPEGFSRPMCAIPGPGMKWVGGLVKVPDEGGRERLIARYSSHKSLGETYETGLAIFNDEKDVLEPLVRFPEDVRLYPDGRPFLCKVGGRDYWYFSALLPIPCVRVLADMKSVTDPTAYEGFTPLVTGSASRKGGGEVERDASGKPVYAWRRNTVPLEGDRVKGLVAAKKLKEDEAPFRFTDIETGKVFSASGDVHWSPYRSRWILIAGEKFGGPSFLGEIWYAEGDTPVGPWVYARKIITHDRYSFYWPGHHAFFDQEGGRIIYLEGTYTDTFSGNPEKTPRYNYNQVMYRLALDDPRLFLPAPVYRVRSSAGGAERYLLREGVEAAGAWGAVEEAVFFAFPPDRAREGLVAVRAVEDGAGTRLEVADPIGPSGSEPAALFFALPADSSTAQQVPSVSGSWRLKAKSESGGDELSCVLRLRQDGDSFTGTVSGTHAGTDAAATVRKGSFQEGVLEIELAGDEGVYTLKGVVAGGRISGRWSRSSPEARKGADAESGSKGEKGTFAGEKEAVEGGWAGSPSVVPLYEYRSGEGGPRSYSTDPDKKETGIVQSPRPICRVWRNPLSVLILDRDAKPGPWPDG